MNKTRLEAFSDGVFAIVITLLVLNIKIPDVDYAHLPSALLGTIPQVMAYIMSFIVIGIYWVGHHQSFHLVSQTDGGFLWLNVLLLLCISFIPFPTILMGKYPFQGIPIIIYGCNLIATNATAFGMLMYLKHHPHLGARVDMGVYIKKHIPVYLIVNGSYLVAMILGCFLPVLSYIIYGSILIVLIIFYGKYKI
jgi:uncharacterized membrane protein